MRLNDFDIGWLVGLIEGDGTFTCDKNSPVIALKITDLDVAQRFALLLKTTALTTSANDAGNRSSS